MLPQSTTTIFGQSVTTDTPATLVSGLTDAAGLSIDTLGNLYVNDDGTVGVLSSSSSPIDGTTVTADTLSTLAVGLAFDLGSTYYNGHVYIADQSMDSVDQLTTPTATISGVTFGGSATNPIMIVTGTGFATSRPTYPIGCSGTGQRLQVRQSLPQRHDECVGGRDPRGLHRSDGGQAEVHQGRLRPRDLLYHGVPLNSGDAFTVGVDGTTFSGTVSYAPPSGATVTNLYPRSGPGGGGTAVTITGTGLSGTKYVFFGSSPATHVSVKSATEVTAVAPSGSATVNVTAVTGSGGVSTAGTRDTFTYLAPTITSISPTKGSTAGGKTVTIKGTNLGGATAVTFGSTPASSFTVNSETEVTAVTPEQNAGVEPVTVTTPGGTSNSANFRFKTPA